jgi:hypothetical protein
MKIALLTWLGLAAVATLFGSIRLRRRLGARMFLRAAVPPLVLIAALAYVMAPLERRSWMADLTQNRRNTLSALSAKVIARARDEVRVSAFFIPGQPGWENPTAVVKAYERLSSKVKVRFIDPNQRPAMAKEYGVDYFGQVVVEGSGRRELANFADEIDVTGAILRLTRTGDPQLCFITGHGERVPGDGAGVGELTRSLERSHLRVKTVALAATEEALSGCDAAIVLGAKVPPLPAERERWQAFLQRDGKALVLLETGGPAMDAWLPAGIHVGEQPVSDRESGLVDDPEAVVAGVFGSANPVTRDLAPVFLLNPRPVIVDRDPEGEGGVSLSKLLMTGPTAKVGDRQEAFLLATGYDRSGIEHQDAGSSRISRSRVVVIGDADWALDGQIEHLDNRHLLGNAIEWLVQQENLVDIASRPVDPPVLLRGTDSRSLLLTNVVLPPSALLTIGAAVAWRRRKA